jgi:hypothetical protein
MTTGEVVTLVRFLWVAVEQLVKRKRFVARVSRLNSKRQNEEIQAE